MNELHAKIPNNVGLSDNKKLQRVQLLHDGTLVELAGWQHFSG